MSPDHAAAIGTYVRILVSPEPSQVRRFVVNVKRRVRPLDRSDADRHSVHIVHVPSGRQLELKMR